MIPSGISLPRVFLILGALLLAPDLARAEGQVPEAYLDQGRVALRAVAGLELDRTFNFGGQNFDALYAGLAGIGASYFVRDELAVDLDLDLRFWAIPGFAQIDAVCISPGVRYHPLPQLFLRGSLPIAAARTPSLGTLVGLGLRQTILPQLYLLVGMDYTLWWNDGYHRRVAPLGRLDLYAGGAFHF